MTVRNGVPIAVCLTGPDADAVCAVISKALRQWNPAHTWIVFNRPCSRRDKLLAHLATGLHSSQWQGISNSANALRVRINQLRDEGFIIDSIPDEGTGLANPSVTYLLRSVPQ